MKKLLSILFTLAFCYPAFSQQPERPVNNLYYWKKGGHFGDTLRVDGMGNSSLWSEAYYRDVQNIAIEYADTPIFEYNRGAGGSWYVPAAIKVGDTTYLFGKRFPNIYVKSSIDGLSYTDNELGQVALTPEGDKIEYAIPLLNAGKDTVNIFYIDQDSLKRAYNLPASLSTTEFTKVPGGLIGLAAINSDLSTTFTSIEIGDIIVFAGRRYYFFSGYNSSSAAVFTYEADNNTPYSLENGIIRLESTDFVEGTTRFQCPSVISFKNRYLLALTAGGNDSIYDQKSIYMGVSQSPLDWSAPFHRTITPNYGESTGLRTYTGYFMKSQDNEWLDPEVTNGKIRYYYSGHSLNYSINEGFVHVAQIDTSFTRNNQFVTKNELDQSLKNYPFILSRQSAQWPAMLRYLSGSTLRWAAGIPNGDDEFFTNSYFISNSTFDFDTPALAIAPDYKIGFSNPSPSFPLDLITAVNAYLSLESTSASSFAGLRLKTPEGVWTIRLDEDGNISIRGGNVVNQKFVLTPNGDVGIGNNVSSASSKLDVSGSIELGLTDWYYYGDPSTNGSWRSGIVGSDLTFQHRQAGTWTTDSGHVSSQWTAMFNWGNHADAGYLTSETQSLQDVVNNGANASNETGMKLQSASPVIIGDFDDVDSDLTEVYVEVNETGDRVNIKAADIVLQGDTDVENDLSVGQDIIQGTSDLWHYFGDPDTDGSFRMGLDNSSGDLVVQARESGSWVTKDSWTTP